MDIQGTPSHTHIHYIGFGCRKQHPESQNLSLRARCIWTPTVPPPPPRPPRPPASLGGNETILASSQLVVGEREITLTALHHDVTARRTTLTYRCKLTTVVSDQDGDGRRAALGTTCDVCGVPGEVPTSQTAVLLPHLLSHLSGVAGSPSRSLPHLSSMSDRGASSPGWCCPVSGHRVTVLLLALCTLVTCNPCSSSSFLFSLMPVPATCRNYALCFRRRALRELPCPRGTAFDPARLFCTSELHQSCLVQESQDKVQTQLTCPRGTTTTYFPDYSQGCPSPRYFLCKNGVISGQTCTEGHVFDEGTDSCVTSLSVVCGVTGPSCSEKSRVSASYADYSLGCPAIKFTMCFHGNVSVVLICPEGLFYNGAVKNCDYPDNIVCGYNVLPRPVAERKY